MGSASARAPSSAPTATQISITTISGTRSSMKSALNRTGTGVVFFSANHSTSRKKPSFTTQARSFMDVLSGGKVALYGMAGAHRTPGPDEKKAATARGPWFRPEADDGFERLFVALV